ncbi:U2 snRNP auxiliary factor small subunit [Actinidia rufa]|uniref:U2 snRNP auxiliary factor small subunit n=2 Tax=Magnoliopsida TaxID=3398 RepID=A0A7J0GQ21_9ERIC|nr:U2 snRNP auxiliary factor small subunit [Actinidia rufa]
MAEHLASIFGTEKDRVNCPFYFKIGACRHGDRCSRLHTKPSISPTLLLSNIYQRPDMITPGVDAHGQPIDPRKMQEHFEDFYEDLFEELSKYGEIESLNVCDNLADHMAAGWELSTSAGTKFYPNLQKSWRHSGGQARYLFFFPLERVFNILPSNFWDQGKYDNLGGLVVQARHQNWISCDQVTTLNNLFSFLLGESSLKPALRKLNRARAAESASRSSCKSMKGNRAVGDGDAVGDGSATTVPTGPSFCSKFGRRHLHAIASSVGELKLSEFPKAKLQGQRVGNVYVQFREEEHAANALKNLSGRFYAGRPIIVDFSPVTDDFREATCRQYEENACNRGGYCNFMHLKRIGRELRYQLFGRYRRMHSLSRSRSRSPYRHRSYDDERTHGGRGHGSGRRDDDRDYPHESRSKRNRSVSPGHRREDEAGAQGEGGTGVQLGKEVKRDVPKLNNGTGKGNKLNKLIRTMLMTPQRL